MKIWVNFLILLMLVINIVHAKSEQKFVKGELIVKFTGEKKINKMIRDLSRNLINYQKALTATGFHKVTFDVDKDIKSVIKTVETISGIEYAEPNYIYSIEEFDSSLDADYIPHDDKFSKQWGLINIGQKLDTKYKMTPGSDIKMLQAWAANPDSINAAEDVVVAVIDTGINLKHRDLTSNLWDNAGEYGAWSPQNQDDVDRAPGCWDKSCNKLDDDNNGYIDDLHGWNWVKSSSNMTDDQGHGSHCAGIIGASHNNYDIAGINSKVQLMGLKFLSKKGEGTLEGAIEAINYAMKMEADVINASWGGTTRSDALGEVIGRATESGILFVAASGNAALNNDYYGSYPANYEYDGVISVAASDFNDNRAFFSNYGKRSVDIAAPGHIILSTTLGKKGYAYMSGTSMAAPHVAGVAAMILGLQRDKFDRAPEKLRKFLMNTSDRKVSLNWAIISGGRLNALNAVNEFIPVGHTAPGRRSIWSAKDISIESAHPYQNLTSQEYIIHEPGAKWIKVDFGRHHLETGKDNVELYDSEGNLFDTLTGFGIKATSRAVKGDTIKMVLKTDKTVTEWGFEVSGYSFTK